MSEQRRLRLQVTLSKLLIGASFLGAGVGCLFAAFSAERSWPEWQKILAFLQFLAAGPLIGAGLFAPANRIRLGAYAGFFTEICAGIVTLALVFGGEVLWDLRYVIAFIILALFAAVLSLFQSIAARRIHRSKRSSL